LKRHTIFYLKIRETIGWQCRHMSYPYFLLFRYLSMARPTW
jgi:hypothetical protein